MPITNPGRPRVSRIRECLCREWKLTEYELEQHLPRGESENLHRLFQQLRRWPLIKVREALYQARKHKDLKAPQPPQLWRAIEVQAALRILDDRRIEGDDNGLTMDARNSVTTGDRPGKKRRLKVSRDGDSCGEGGLPASPIRIIDSTDKTEPPLVRRGN
jgi:hypothetical protein